MHQDFRTASARLFQAVAGIAVAEAAATIADTLIGLTRIRRRFVNLRRTFFRLTKFRRERSLGRRFRCVEISGGQVRGFPIHRHPDPGAAAGVIEENEFLERTWIEFAIRGEF